MRGAVLLAVVLLVFGCTGTEGTGPQPDSIPGEGSDDVKECSGPVCGTDGVTYGTDCEATIAGATIDHAGECVPRDVPSDDPEAAPCKDSDNGILREEKGSVEKGDESFTDYCIDDDQLIEYACVDGSVDMVSIKCGDEDDCVDGACVPIEEEPDAPPVDPGCSGPVTADILKKESVIHNGTSYDDVCIDFTTVKDYYCRNNAPDSVNNQCPSGYGCNAGECYAFETTCVDKDGGKDLDIKSKVVFTKGYFTTIEYDDVCLDTMIIEEYYCDDDGAVAIYEHWCPSGSKCSEGRCIRSKCTDTDEGKDEFVKGHVQIKEDEWTDYCFNDDEVLEYYCDGDSDSWTRISCGSGYSCDGGECVPD